MRTRPPAAHGRMRRLCSQLAHCAASTPSSAPVPLSGAAAAAPLPLSSADVELYRRQGFILVRSLLPAEDLDAICAQADAFAQIYPAYQAQDAAKRAEIEAAHAQTAPSFTSPEIEPTSEDLTAEVLSPRHSRLGNRYYPLRRGPPGDSMERQALWEHEGDPWVVGEQRPIQQLNGLTDNDPTMREMAAHPRIVSVLQMLLSPDVKLWFDHIWCKPPLSHATEGSPAPGANRLHQDGFFQFSRPSLTCWIAIDHCGVTEDNGAFHYLPLTAGGGYGEFGFDIMGRGSGEGLSVDHLREAQVVTLRRGDAVFVSSQAACRCL